MARTIVEAFFSIANSPFASPKERQVSRRYPPKFVPLPRDYEQHRKFHDEMQRYLTRRAVGLKKANDITSNVDLICAVAGASLTPQAAWHWLLDQFEQDCSELFGDHAMRSAASFARGRLATLFDQEHRRSLVATNTRAASHRAMAFAAEKAANGGDSEFFNSGKWQRLRYEILSESNGCCALCGRSAREHGVALEVDHIRPRSRFPNLALTKGNLQVLCFDCNRGKGNRCTTDWRADETAGLD